jgi:hypothetical protein
MAMVEPNHIRDGRPMPEIPSRVSPHHRFVPRPILWDNPPVKDLIRVFILLLATILAGNSSAETSTNTSVKDLGEGRLQIGRVTVDSKARTLSFPAKINMTEGMVEYLIVTTKGKTHESLLSTEAEPVQIHAGMLLLGAKAEATNDASIFFDAKRDIPGTKLKITVSSPVTQERTTEIQTLLMFAQTKQPLTPDAIPHWIYNGSRFSETPDLEPVAAGSPTRSGNGKKEAQKVFMAQREGSILSLIADPSALINNPRKDRENDELWILNTAAIPPVGTPVAVIFVLQ